MQTHTNMSQPHNYADMLNKNNGAAYDFNPIPQVIGNFRKGFYQLITSFTGIDKTPTVYY